MIIRRFSLVIIVNLLKETEISYALTTKKMQLPESFTEDNNLKLQELRRTKHFLDEMNKSSYNDDQKKDPSTYCRSFNNCFECVRSMWYPCGWCHMYGCTENPEKLCPFTDTKAEKSNITGPIKACPHVQHEGPILVPSGVIMKIKVKLYIPDPAIYDKGIICQIKIKDSVTHLKGLLLNNIVRCYPVILDLQAIRKGDTDRGFLRIIWGGAQPTSNPVPLIVYDCEILATDCESCMTIPTAYLCGWCDLTSKCVIADKCSNDLKKWSLKRLTCEDFGRSVNISIPSNR